MSRCRRCEPVPEEVRQTAALLERRWQLSILYAALLGAQRFNEYVESIGDISARMLTEPHRELETAGLVEQAVVETNPPYIGNTLTVR
ncbi:MAG: helix-turn-helix domain-containing protein, partial [Solirubrobacteraceae bacterium]|nr:helix-turn-helix domain-containing protein [Solirubrobacteraceae bacterium]